MLFMPKRIPEETKQRAIRLVLDHLDEYPNLTAACETVSARLGFGAESLRRWVRQAQIDGGERQGVTSSESERMRRLERENRELREANAMADSTGQRNGCSEMKQTLISGGIDCRANMVISVVSRNSSLSVFTRRGGGSSISPARSAARRRWSAAWRGRAVTSTGSLSAGSHARGI